MKLHFHSQTARYVCMHIVWTTKNVDFSIYSVKALSHKSKVANYTLTVGEKAPFNVVQQIVIAED